MSRIIKKKNLTKREHDKEIKRLEEKYYGSGGCLRDLTHLERPRTLKEATLKLDSLKGVLSKKDLEEIAELVFKQLETASQ